MLSPLLPDFLLPFRMTNEELNALRRRDLVLESTRTLAAEFVQMNLAIGLSFARLYLLNKSNQNWEKAIENHNQAQEALRTALKFVNRAGFSGSDNPSVVEKINELEELLHLS